MLLFKPKKYDEILPPPPPVDMETGKKPKLFDEVIKPKKAETFPEQEEFSKLVNELEESAAPKKRAKKEKVPIKAVKSKEQKIPVKQAKGKKAPLKIAKKVKKPEAIGLNKDFGLKELDFELPEEFELSGKDIELPDTLEDFDIKNIGKELNIKEDFGKELGQEAEKPREIFEAEEEIKSAIEKIKQREKPSFFRKLFARKKEEMPEEQAELPADKISAIQNNINEARQALMEFNLEKAKKGYIEAMSLYNQINPEEQAKGYHDIKELYFERKSAEGLKI